MSYNNNEVLDEDDIGLSQEDRNSVRTNKLDWYKAEKGRIDRVALVYFNTVAVTAMRVAARNKTPKEELPAVAKKALEAQAKSLGKSVDELTDIDKLNMSDVRFRKFLVHYIDQESFKGYYLSRMGMDGPEADRVWQNMPEAKQYLTTLFLVYPTTRDGEILKDSEGAIKIVPWRFSPERYQQIVRRNNALVANNLTIASQDLIIECKDTQFQNISIDVAGPARYRNNPKFQSFVMTKALPLYDKLCPFREISTADLRVKLGMGAPSASASVDANDYMGMLQNV
jgi:hypothetical protein